ncbi:response regulator [Sphingomonas sp. RT2P30]|uniref:response regulator n=1 Tax=Parasphingomonas halimpatiens TaxID=3096162 RepID=UPI002FC872E9
MWQRDRWLDAPGGVLAMTAVYILDDDHSILTSLEVLVGHLFDVEITVFSRVEDLYAQIDGLAPGLLLVDHQMPECTGVEVIRTLVHRAGTRLSMILMSGCVDAALIDVAKAAGASAVIEKPCSADALRQVIERSPPQLRSRSARTRLQAPPTSPETTRSGGDYPTARRETDPASALIYLADDDDIFAEGACSALIDLGHGADWVSNGVEALAAIRRRRPDVLILDCDMPKLSGMMLLRLLRMSPEWATLPIIMLTAHTHERDRERALFAGANAYLSKPLDSVALGEQIVAMLQASSGSADRGAARSSEAGGSARHH